MVAFTGTRRVGCRINQLAAEHPTSRPALKRVIAEMGGKNAIIVDSDADLDEAIKGVTVSAFGYAGQRCSAASRCIVVEPLHDRFVERLVESVRGSRVGPADDSATAVPPVIDQQTLDSIREMIAVGKHEAKCVLEVDAHQVSAENDNGYYIGPTVFTDVKPDARIAQEEIDGPVLAIIKARDFDHAIEIFNGTDYALTGGIFSRSPANLERARKECECGNLYINRVITGSHVDLQPFGGFKMSGLGTKIGGPDYLIQFCEPRTITENTLRRGFAPSEEVVESLG
jgi:RHH-type proline utilization regulon transcriptional repressor/proline dehydrogenase/delta 1-pyrroline-5-carboxylate dehydrogenase